LTLLKKLGVARLISGTLVSSGRAARSIDTAPPTPAQYRDLLDRYYNDDRFKYDYRQMGNFAGLEWLAGRSATVPHACRCADMPYVTADGIFYPCLLLPHPSYAIAGVFSRPIEDILEQAASQWQDLSQWYNRRRTQLAQCLDCPGHGHCGGGCLGRAVAAGGDFMQVEDRCALRKAVYRWEPV
jgi:radical SAM protein with 4Fe4S-binding SPASM domain